MTGPEYTRRLRELDVSLARRALDAYAAGPPADADMEHRGYWRAEQLGAMSFWVRKLAADLAAVDGAPTTAL